MQSPELAAEVQWARDAAAPAPGGLLLATPAAPQLLGPQLQRAVVLLLALGPGGAAGLVLNRPTPLRVGQGRDAHGLALPSPAADGPFNSRLNWGGPSLSGRLSLLHGDPRRRMRGSLELPLPRVYVETNAVCVSGVAAGDLGEARPPSPACKGRRSLEHGGGVAASSGVACVHAPCLTRASPLPLPLPLTPSWQGTLRFFAGRCAWGPGELERQVAQGAWQPVAASRALVLKHTALLPVDLYDELLALTGGCFAEVPPTYHI